MVLVGILLVSGLALVALETVSYTRGGYTGAFWKLPLDEKLDHVAQHMRDWWWLSIWGLVGLFTMSGGVLGFGYLLADAGEPVLTYVSLGGYLVAAMAWVFGVSIQAAAISAGATEKVETGQSPLWLRPLWNTAYVTEGVWVIGSNIAYAVMGVALLQTDLVAPWAGWVAIVGGALIILSVLVTRTGFPQLATMVPAAIGIALLIEAL